MREVAPLKIVKIVQISDTHLFKDSEKLLLGVQTQKSLEAILDHIRQHEVPFDFLLHTGDLSQDASKETYLRLADMLSTFNVPIYCVPGNHDDPGLMDQLYPSNMMTNEKHILTKHWQMILLDSHKPKSVEGYLQRQELDFLEHCLKKNKDHFSIVVFHHQPMAVNSAWLDNLGLKNSNELWEIISHYQNLKLVLFGHIHQQYDIKQQHVFCYAAPSTCIQFMRNQDHFGLENLPQGYRSITLYSDGHFETSVVRLTHYVGQYEVNAKGY